MKFIKLTIYSLTFIILGFSFANSASAASVFYSVGQDNTTNLMTGTPDITGIVSDVATFDTAQTGNIGVGDRVTYETGVEHICYISAKQSTSVWDLVTATGAACPDHASTDVVSIHREYDSLFNAEAGALDANHINSATGDLVTQTTILNLPCYYDNAAEPSTFYFCE